MKIVATTSLPAVNRPNANRWNAARSRQKVALFITKYLLAVTPMLVATISLQFLSRALFNGDKL